MSHKSKKIDPLPDDSASLEEIAEFWSTHDTTDYPHAFRTVDATFDVQRRHYEIEVHEDVFHILKKKSEALHVPVEKVVDKVLRRELVY